MSCDWNIKCVECGDIHHFNDANHAEELMVNLIRNALTLAELHHHVSKLDIPWPAEGVTLKTAYGDVDFAFFRKHLGHTLRPFNEYGQYLGDCTSRYRCACCNSWLTCKKPEGHDGEHGHQ